jgi:hypothetical protein
MGLTRIPTTAVLSLVFFQYSYPLTHLIQGLRMVASLKIRWETFTTSRAVSSRKKNA